MIEITQEEYYRHIDRRCKPEDILPGRIYLTQERLLGNDPDIYALQYFASVQTKSEPLYRTLQTILSVCIDTDEGPQEDELILDQEGYILDNEDYAKIGYLMLINFDSQDMLPFVSKELELK